MTRGRFFASLAVALTAVAFLGCGGGTALDLQGGHDTSYSVLSSANPGNVAVPVTSGTYHPTFQPIDTNGESLSNLIQDSPNMPVKPSFRDQIDTLELPDFTAFNASEANQRTVSAVDVIALDTYAGATAGVSFDTDTLTIPSAAGTTEWAHFALALDQTEDFLGLAVTGSLTPAATDSTGLWVAISNYSLGHWVFQGPFDLSAQVLIDDIDAARYGGLDDMMHIVLITTDGDQADITELKVNRESGANDIPPDEFRSAVLDAGINYALLSLQKGHDFYNTDNDDVYLSWHWGQWAINEDPINGLRTMLPAYWSAWSGSEDPGFFQSSFYPNYQDEKRDALEALTGIQNVLHEGIANHHPFHATTPEVFEPALPVDDSLAEAVASLVTATGGTPDLPAYQAALASLSDTNQDALARVVMATEEAYTARATGYAAQENIEALFAEIHGHWMSNLYGANSGILSAVAPSGYFMLQFPYRTMFFEGASKITDAMDGLDAYIDASVPVWEDVNLEVETPGGLIKIGGTTDDNHLARRPAIIGKDNGSNTYTVAGDMVAAFPAGTTFSVYGATTDNFGKTVLNSAVNGPNTDIVVEEALSDSVADGEIHLNGYLVLIDLGGNDTYTCTAGATATAANGVSVCIDLDGNDTYLPLDDPLDGNREDDNDDNTPQYGAARMGIGILADFAGDDAYTGTRMTQGSTVFGVGMLVDLGAGDDTYTAESFCQGSAIAGVGLLFDDGAATGNDYLAWASAQGYGSVMGVGMLIQHGTSNDTFYAEPNYNPARPEYNSSGTFADINNQNFSQGCGFGLAFITHPISLMPVTGPGGYGLLFDSAGDDTYTASHFSQGFGYFQGHGLLIDNAGDDQHEGTTFTQAAALFCGVGSLWDGGGSDTYFNSSGVGIGGADDGAVSWFYDVSGHDSYDSAAVSLGTGLRHAYGFFIDAFGNDTYSGVFADPATQCLGRGGWPGASSALNFNIVTDPAIGIFVDARGADFYAPGFAGMLLGTDDTTLVDTPPANGAQWIRAGGTYTDGGFYADGIGSGIDGE